MQQSDWVTYYHVYMDFSGSIVFLCYILWFMCWCIVIVVFKALQDEQIKLKLEYESYILLHYSVVIK